MDLKVTEWENMEWIRLAQEGTKAGVFVRGSEYTLTPPHPPTPTPKNVVIHD